VRLDVYDPALQSEETANASYLVIRSSADVASIASRVRAEAHRLDPAVVVDSITTLDAIVSRAVAPWRFSTWMLTLFATLGFVLAAVGLFSVVSLDVATPRHELAVRVAVGAQRSHLVRSVLLPAAWRILTGMTAGAAAAAFASLAICSLLFAVRPIDVPTWIAVLLLVAAVVAIASYLPARRALSLVTTLCGERTRAMVRAVSVRLAVKELLARICRPSQRPNDEDSHGEREQGDVWRQLDGSVCDQRNPRHYSQHRRERERH
jgi:hypothetical protein